MGKFVGWIIGIGVALLVLYAIFSGLPGDVLSPFHVPNP